MTVDLNWMMEYVGEDARRARESVVLESMDWRGL